MRLNKENLSDPYVVEHTKRGRRKRALFAAQIAILVVALSISAIVVYGWAGAVYASQALLSFGMGFAVVSRGTIFTEKRKTDFSIVAIGASGVAIIFSILSKMWGGLIISVVNYFVFSALGEKVYNLISEEA